MIITTYTKKGTWKRQRCDICSHIRWCCQHHIYGRRTADDVIWVCSNGNPAGVLYTEACHQRIHNPTAFGLPSSWAYDNGYLQRTDSKYRPKKSKPSKWKLKI